MPTYKNFSIDIRASKNGVYSVLIDSPVGTCESTFELPFLEQENIGKALAGFGARLRGTRDMVPLDAPEESSFNATAEQLGTNLFTALIHGDAKALWQDSVQLTSTSDTVLRLKIHLQVDSSASAKLSQLPWELLRDPQSDRFLNLSERTPIVRYLDVPTPYSALPFNPPFRVLVVISNPQNVAKLDLKRERELISSSWGSRADVQVEFLEKATTAALQSALQAGEFHALHFMGHGDFDQETGRGVLVMEDDDQQAQLLSARALGVLLTDSPTLRFVFLNACKTAQADATNNENAYAGIASALLLAGVPAVVAMQFPISDEAAIAFSETFYRLLPTCRPLEFVVAEARKSVFTLQDSAGKNEWATPVLFMRTDDGRVFESKYKKEPLRGKDQQLLAELTGRVRQFWIEGKLYKDIPIRPPIELTKELSRKSVQREIDEFDEVESDDEETLVPAGKTIGVLYDEYDRSLLVLGDPGYGKTITLLALASQLMDRHLADPSEPVPTVLFLSTWSVSQLPIDKWIVDEISKKYKIPKKLAHQWMVDDRIVLLLDGLDEVTAERRNACVEAINDFMRQQLEYDGRCCLAVCCRYEEYERLTARFTFENAVKLQPLSESQIREFLAKFESEMEGLQRFLESDPNLFEEAKSPLMLGMMSIAYSLNPDQFASYTKELAIGAEEQDDHKRSCSRRQLMVETYLDRVFKKKRAKRADYSEEKTIEGASWLAKQMRKHHQNIFLIEDLQPTWLATRWQRVSYLALYSLLMGLVFGLILTSVWYVSNYVDPAAPGVQDTQPYWLIGCPIWIFCVSIFEYFRIATHTKRLRAGKHPWWPKSRVASVILRTGLFYGIWLMIWYPMGMMFRVNAVPLQAWMGHPFQCGISLSIVYSFAVGGRTQDSYIGMTELLKWSPMRSTIGLAIGASIGFVRWCVYIAVYWIPHIIGRPVATNTDFIRNLYFYVPMWAAIGALFGGFRLGMVEGKTRPNEGIWLSMRNAVFAAMIIGPGMALLLGAISRLNYEQPWDKVFISALIQLNIFLVLAACVFGLVDVIRHYTLRWILAMTGTLPMNIAKFYDHMDELILLQKIGGGYIFRNHLLFDYFAQRKPGDERGAAKTSFESTAWP